MDLFDLYMYVCMYVSIYVNACMYSETCDTLLAGSFRCSTTRTVFETCIRIRLIIHGTFEKIK